MKAIFEGSPADIRAVVADSTASYNEGRAQLQIENLEADINRLKTEMSSYIKDVETADRTTSVYEKKLGEALSSYHATKTELASKNAHIANLEAELQKLQFEVRSLRTKTGESTKTHALSPMQEAEIEAVFQDTLRENSIKPLVFSSTASQGREISAEFVVTTIFNVLANGNRAGAIKEIRAVTGMNIVKARDLIDNALRRFGCNTDERGMVLSASPVKISEKND